MARPKKDFKANIQEKINLPSRGIPYGDDIPESFTMKPMTLNETKIIYGSSNTMNALDSVLKKCINIEDFPVHKLLLGDKLYLAYQLRALTFGEMYNVSLFCPTCKKPVDVSFNLTQAEIDYAPDNFEMYKNIGKLPYSGDEIVTKVLTVGDYENLMERAEEIKREYPEYEGDPILPLSVAAQIYTINGEKRPSRLKEEYATNMHAMDEIYFSEKVQNIAIGPKVLQHIDCPECGRNLEFAINMGEQFFRPKLSF